MSSASGRKSLLAPGTRRRLRRPRRRHKERLALPQHSPNISGTVTEAGHHSIGKGLQPWTLSADADLSAAIRHEASLNEAALFLCRSPDEVARRAAELGLEWSNSNLR